MKNLFKEPLFYLSTVLILILGFVSYDIASAQFSEPSSSFPDGNPSAPLSSSILSSGDLDFSGNGRSVIKLDSGHSINFSGEKMTANGSGAVFGGDYRVNGNISFNGDTGSSVKMESNYDTPSGNNHEGIIFADNDDDPTRMIIGTEMRNDGHGGRKNTLVVFNDGDGNDSVGVGDYNPSYKLDVNGIVSGNHFRDRNNTSYYINPGGDSNLNGDVDLNGGGLQDSDYIDFQNHEHGDFDTDGRLYWDLSAGLYIKSSNAGGSQSGGSLLWSSENVTAGDNIDISYNGEDEPTISASTGGGPSYERVSNETNATVGTNRSEWVSVSCPSGTEVVGGGCDSDNYNVTISNNSPSGSDGWSCRFASYQNGINTDLTASAICR